MNRKAKVLTVGVAVVDIVMNVDEMPRLAEKYRARAASVVGGGCGANAAVAISRLMGDAVLAARLGEDEIADMIIGGIEPEGVDCSLVRRFKSCRSSFSSIFIDNKGDRQIVNFRDPNMPNDVDWLKQRLGSFDGVLVDNRWTEGAEAALLAAREQGVPGVVDAEAPILDTQHAMETASHVVFSAQGLRDFSGVDDVISGLDYASELLGGFVGVTDGADGVWWKEGRETEHLTGFDVDVVDTLGAGDVWHGAFTLALAEGMPTRKALEFSNAVAAIKCTKQGGRQGSPTREETEAFIRENKLCN